jgi:hypothetical protein
MNPRPRPSHVTADHIPYAASCLTDRDRHIALDCHEHGALTTDQLARLHFTKVRTARDRLTRLYGLRVLDRFRPALTPGDGTAPFHWVLDEVGARIVAAEQGVSRDALRWRHATALGLARSATLDHRMAVNEFFVRLAVEARAAGGALREWYGERTTRHLLDGIAIPDGYGVLALPDRNPLHLLLELDRGTEPLRRIRDKVDRYAKAIPRSELADADPLVLFLVPTTSRTEHIAHLLSGADDARARPIRCRAWCWSPRSTGAAVLDTVADDSAPVP